MPPFSTALPSLTIFWCFHHSHCNWMKHFLGVSVCTLLMTKGIEHSLMQLLVTCNFSIRTICPWHLPFPQMGYLLSVEFFVYVFWILILAQVNDGSYSVDFLFVIRDCFCCQAEHFIFYVIQFVYFCFNFLYFGSHIPESSVHGWLDPRHKVHAGKEWWSKAVHCLLSAEKTHLRVTETVKDQKAMQLA